MISDQPLIWHSAQALDNLKPDIIYKGKENLELPNYKAQRQNIVSQMDQVILEGTKISNKEWPKVIIYYKSSSFVVKTTPEENDSYGRLAPILSYSEFPQNQESFDQDKWIESIRTKIVEFTNSIERKLSPETQKAIIEALETLCEKKTTNGILISTFNKLAIYGMVAIVPLIIGAGIYQMIPQIIEPIIQQNSEQILNQQNLQQLLIKLLQEVLQKVIFLLTGLVAISNIVMMLILQFPSLSIVSRYKRKKK